MIQSPQTIQIARDGVVVGGTVAWRYEQGLWVVELASPGFDPVVAREDDAFEALSAVRERVEPLGWRLGVAGAQLDVWPSGMSRDQGGGLSAYRMTADGAGSVVETFEPVDPASVTSLARQRAHIEGLIR